MLAAVLRAETDAFVAQHVEELLPDGCQRLGVSRRDRLLSRLLLSRRPHSSLDAPSPDQAYFQPANARGGSGVTEAENHLENARILLK